MKTITIEGKEYELVEAPRVEDRGRHIYQDEDGKVYNLKPTNPIHTEEKIEAMEYKEVPVLLFSDYAYIDKTFYVKNDKVSELISRALKV